MLNIYEECLRCRKCEISNHITNKVFGTGNTKAKVILIGEAPGANEDKQGKPFVGRAGKLLNSFLQLAGLNREDVYITNIIKCRPPGNRNPNREEIENCIGFLKKEIEIINPEIIVTLGSVASRTLIKPDLLITKERGKFFKIKDYLIMPTFHPAAVLRDPRRKELMEKDFLKIAKL